MRGIDHLIILAHGRTEQDNEWRQGLPALAARNRAKAGRVHVAVFSDRDERIELRDADFGNGGRIGIYVYGHAYGMGASSYTMPAEDLAQVIAGVVEQFSNAHLAKVAFTACNVAATPGEAEAPEMALRESYVARFARVLATGHGLTPMVAGWLGYVSVISDDPGREDYGAKTRSWQRNKEDRFGRITPFGRRRNKLVWQWINGALVPLENAAGWSDKTP